MTVTDVTRQPTDAERFHHILQAQRAAYLRDGAPSLVLTPSGNVEHQNALPPMQRPGPGRGEHLRKEATDG
ncbi:MULTISPECIES: hypothetical protein [Streptomyces]|jgi:coniferyl-aldehyde dehydrogenase|uniref:Uncharacterized protein n=1 Tax=Streptomyces sp. 900129855 TaxID=3155129 RepID=A0ABV2ZXS3_9ACTN